MATPSVAFAVGQGGGLPPPAHSIIKPPEEEFYPTPSSKYDFVKVRVWLEDHYYVLSRFLISRVLNVTKVNSADSVKIALELKKRLVDEGILNVSQGDMENLLFHIMQSYGYGEKYIYRYRMTTRFHHQRVPLIILLCGTRCTGKSWLATQLAERLNLSTVLQTTLVQNLMSSIMRDLPEGIKAPEFFPPPHDTPLIYRDLDQSQFISDFKKECYMIRQGVDTDIEKCFEEGKAIIIEGHSLDPAMFIELIQERSMDVINPSTSSHNTFSPTFLSSLSSSSSTILEPIISLPTMPSLPSSSSSSLPIVNSSPVTPIVPSAPSPSSSSSSSSSSTQVVAPSGFGESSTTNNTILSTTPPQTSPITSLLPSVPSTPKKKKITKGIIVPFFLRMSPSDHRLLVENWISCSIHDQKYASTMGADPADQITALTSRLQILQDYLGQNVPPFIEVQVSARSFMDTLDTLHSIVLERIQQVYAGPTEGFRLFVALRSVPFSAIKDENFFAKSFCSGQVRVSVCAGPLLLSVKDPCIVYLGANLDPSRPSRCVKVKIPYSEKFKTSSCTLSPSMPAGALVCTPEASWRM
eukprot:TRINITY_DN4384_c0_g1_i4.p1 TRINITY_DN4384_c0_g1~~TRINITY_DN4384_c0_g1_i4.p1  ORF type:complete len:600 (-),score=149.07 TRINITY_DN4384_c0_g1_i4:32-1774(-)